MSRSLRSYQETHVGLKRGNNQDSLLVDPDINLFAVADGMGGHKGGEIASSLAVKTLHEHLKSAIESPDFLPDQSLLEGFHLANKIVFEKSKENEDTLTGMGTTLVACLFQKDVCFFANVGDSRIYLFNHHLWRLTEDHSIIGHQIKKRLITEEQVPLLTETNVITRSIGFMPEVEVDLCRKKIAQKDIFILCSDGLHGMIQDEKISELCKKSPPKELARQCVQSALDAGGNDNISIIVVTT